MKAIHRIFKYIENKGIKPTRLEKEVGLSNGYLGTQLKRDADLGEGVLNKIVGYCLDINPEWLLTGTGPMLRDERPAQPSAQVPDTSIYEERLADKDKIIQRDSELITALQHRIASLERNGSAHSDASALRSARTAE